MCDQQQARLSIIRLSICGAIVLACLTIAPAALADPSIHFELRLAPGQNDAVLTLGDSNDDELEIEVWAEITDAEPGTLFKSYLLLLRGSQDGVINYTGDFASPAFSLGCVFPAPDNSPSSGDLTPSCLALGDGVPDGVESPGLIATFSVQAQALGATSYGFAPNDGGSLEWGAFISDTMAPGFITLDDSDCGDGSCNVTGSIDPALAVIQVVDVPPVPRSPDADDDGDVDARDYAWMQRCADELPGSLSDDCLRVDLTMDEAVDGGDMMEFTTQMTGIRPPFGDVDGDFDVDLADFARYQICNGPNGIVGIEDFCALADTNRDGTHDEADLAKLVERLTGPIEY